MFPSEPRTFIFVCLSLISFKECHAYKILVFYHPVAKSHSMFMNYTAQALRKDGHNVTFVHVPLTESADEIVASSDANVPFWVFRDTATIEDKKFLQKTVDDILWDTKIDVKKIYSTIYALAKSLAGVCKLLDNEEILRPLRELQADMMIVDATLIACVQNIPHMLNVPYIESVGVSLIMQQALNQACPFPPSYVTGNLIPIAKLDGFADRLKNALDLILNFFSGLLLYTHSSLSRTKYVSPFAFDHMMSNISHYLVNDDPFLLPTRPTVQSVHLTGGQFTQNARSSSLPQDLDSFLSAHTKGTIIVSLSTMSKSTSMPSTFKEVFVETFKRFPPDYGIIWRYEGEATAASNMSHVKIGPWFPLKSLLADPRILVLVTHGGINSVMEAAYYGVALVGIPLFGDQSNILLRAQQWTHAQIVTKHELSPTLLTSAIHNAIHNKELHKRVARFQSFVSDRILNPAEEGKFWVEHTLRHRGNMWHKPKGVQLSFWTYYYCDFMSLISMVMLSLFTLIYLCYSNWESCGLMYVLK